MITIYIGLSQKNCSPHVVDVEYFGDDLPWISSRLYHDSRGIFQFFALKFRQSPLDFQQLLLYPLEFDFLNRVTDFFKKAHYSVSVTVENIYFTRLHLLKF